MSAGVIASSRRRSVAATGPTNLVSNGDFASGTAGWSGFGEGGKTVTSGRAQFTATGAYNGISQPVTLTAGKYYQVQYTVSGLTAGDLQIRLTGGGTDRQGAFRTANGTYTERLLANTGNTLLAIFPGSTSTFAVDDVSVFGPYDTATIGGA